MEGVAGGAKQVMWGTGKDRVDLRIGLWYLASGEPALATVAIRGTTGTVYQLEPGDTAVSWTERGCDYTVFLDSSLSAESIADFAARY